MAEQFSVGDVVQLKSGGPKMTISKVEEWNGAMRARCDWFEGTHQHQGVFPLTSLNVADESARHAQVGGGRTGTQWS